MKLKIFDALADGALSAQELARQTGLVEHLTEAFLEFLVVLKLLEKQGDTYALVPMSREFLVSSSPVYQKAMFDLTGHFNRVMEQIEPLLQSIRTLRISASTRTRRRECCCWLQEEHNNGIYHPFRVPPIASAEASTLTGGVGKFDLQARKTISRLTSFPISGIFLQK